MGWAKTDEDIREKIDIRMRNSGTNYYGNTYFNRYPDYISRKSSNVSTTYHVPINKQKPVLSTFCSTSTYRTAPTPSIVSSMQPKKKNGYVKKNNVYHGIEIYFYSRPNESILDELKEKGWSWHRKKKCWYNCQSVRNQSFAEKIIEK